MVGQFVGIVMARLGYHLQTIQGTPCFRCGGNADVVGYWIKPSPVALELKSALLRLSLHLVLYSLYWVFWGGEFKKFYQIVNK